MATYSFIDVKCTLAAAGMLINLGNGAAVAEEGIEFGSTGDRNTMTVGADGEGMHSLHADKSGPVTVRLLKAAPANQKLMMLYDTQSMSSSLWGTNIIRMTNPQTGDQVIARSCAFKRRPDLRFKKDADIVEWVFDAIKIDSYLGSYSDMENQA